MNVVEIQDECTCFCFSHVCFLSLIQSVERHHTSGATGPLGSSPRAPRSSSRRNVAPTVVAAAEAHAGAVQMPHAAESSSHLLARAVLITLTTITTSSQIHITRSSSSSISSSSNNSSLCSYSLKWPSPRPPPLTRSNKCCQRSDN